MMRQKILFFIILVFVIIGGICFIFVRGDDSFLSNVKCHWSQVNCPFYAVHLNNGQVYFGHLVSRSRDTITLSNTHFLELYEQKGDAVATSSSFALQQAPKQLYRMVERGGDKTLATDHTLFINRTAVLFWEKLTPESEVVKLIASEK